MRQLLSELLWPRFQRPKCPLSNCRTQRRQTLACQTRKCLKRKCLKLACQTRKIRKPKSPPRPLRQTDPIPLKHWER